MKKIVSLALSTAMALSMFASVTSAATLTTQEKYNQLVDQKIFAGYPDGNAYLDKDMTRAEFAKVVALLTGLDTSATGTNSYQDPNYANAWYKPYVEAVTKAGYMKGTTTGSKKLFNPNGKVTVQEMAATLVRAAKLDVPTTGINNNASAWAKGEVQAAINAGLISNTANFTAAATRGLLVDTAYAYQTAVVKPAVTSYEVQNNGRTVVFTLANGEKVTVNLEKALVANTATTVNFTYDGKEYSESVTWTVTSATQVEGVTATNLREVTVKFNGKVDPATATDAKNYTLGTGTIASASISEDETTVTLLLSTTLTNQVENTLSVQNVKAGDRVITASNVRFTPVDNALPTVTNVRSLGTKAIMVTFSEPIQDAANTAFRLDGQAFYGSVQTTGREVVLTPYGGALTIGEHTLTVGNVTDFSGLRSLSSDNKFTVVEDTTAPTITSVEATLERAVVTFSEEVDPSTVAAANAYWTAGSSSTQRTASAVTKLSNTKYSFDFSANPLPAYAATLTLNGVKDYSGNALNPNTATVTATVDVTKPVVNSVRVETNTTGTAPRSFVVTYSKPLSDASASVNNFRVTNSSGVVQGIQSVAFVPDSNYTAIRVTTYGDLPSGNNTLRITGITDRTQLRNAADDYTGTLNVANATLPSLGTPSINPTTRTVVIPFNKAMDIASLTNRSNYLITFNGRQVVLPQTVEVQVTQNAQAVVLTFPATIDNTAVTFGNTLTAVTVQAVRDAQGNVLRQFTENQGENRIALAAQAVTLARYSNDYPANYVAAVTAARTVQVKFSQGLGTANASDFRVNGTTPVAASVNGSVVTLTTASDISNTTMPTIEIVQNNSLRTTAGTAVYETGYTVQAANVLDLVAPTVTTAAGNTLATTTVANGTYAGRTAIVLPFSENIQVVGGAEQAAYDLTVTRVNGNARLVAGTDYTTAVSGNELWVILAPSARTVVSTYDVTVNANQQRITDTSAANNKATGDVTRRSVEVPVQP
ncbi:S-layer homology domain-containing protein [Saccharibacillus alkalitolerans]|uniref:S-layer homology domain-containing protein n=1 Tax=Saccharibacillus alkalitolerans TaxID=2705290 RepID=A0ABX0FA96_9BACL|nr:S-layer homology domain-containing protein [Saccharibacillus alkalitolerans]NGZ76136.1 S-layer homology domain-containing protein [Saccharibacillus alkalitolerans]